MRHPLTGGGMSVVLNDVRIWRDLLKNIPDLYDNTAVLQVTDAEHSESVKRCAFLVPVIAVLAYEIKTTFNINFVAKQSKFPRNCR